MLDPNMLPMVRIVVAGIAGCFVALFLAKFVQFWLEARRFNRTRRRGF